MQPPLPPVFLPRPPPAAQPLPPAAQPLPASPAAQPQARLPLHHCSAQWSKMKLSGEASGKLWRDFAAVCLKQ